MTILSLSVITNSDGILQHFQDYSALTQKLQLHAHAVFDAFNNHHLLKRAKSNLKAPWYISLIH